MNEVETFLFIGGPWDGRRYNPHGPVRIVVVPVMSWRPCYDPYCEAEDRPAFHDVSYVRRQIPLGATRFWVYVEENLGIEEALMKLLAGYVPSDALVRKSR